MGYDEALNGVTVRVDGNHTFTVKAASQQVIAKAKTIMVFDPESNKARWAGKDTGSYGIPVTKGCRVFVNDADEIVFQ